MSHLLLVLCFAQSIIGSIWEHAETLKIRRGCILMVAWGERDAATDSEQGFQETAMQGITNKYTTFTQLEPVFWNMVKSNFPLTGETLPISLLCHFGSQCPPQPGIFTADRRNSWAASTTDTLLSDSCPACVVGSSLEQVSLDLSTSFSSDYSLLHTPPPLPPHGFSLHS
jgi:hypothetical protein